MAPRSSSKVRSSEDLDPPFPSIDMELSKDDLRETAFEILVAACGPPPSRIGYTGIKKTASLPRPPERERERSISSAAASRMKKALGLRSKKHVDPELSNAPTFRSKKQLTPLELARIQMGISEKSDARTRKALSRAAAGKVGRGGESLLVPVELLQNISSLDFADSAECQKWKTRLLNVLEAGLLCHPKVKLNSSDLMAQRLKQVLYEIRKGNLETGRNNEALQSLRSACMALTSRDINDEKVDDVCHWADGFPLNIHLYHMLLQSCFDSQEEGAVIDEMDELMDIFKNTWTMLGLNQVLHNVCFLWVLFHQFVITGQSELELLGATETQLEEVAKDAKMEQDPLYIQLLSSTLSAIQGWADKQLFAYRVTFPAGDTSFMERLLPFAISAAQVLHDDISQEYRRRRKEQVNVANVKVDSYIRSSLKTAFAQMMEGGGSKRRPANGQTTVDPIMVALAKATSNILLDEKKIYSPILKRWHPYAAGVAAATLHTCYRTELTQYLSGVKVLTIEAAEVLKSADALEKELVQTAVEDAVDSEDGGKGIIRQMPPFEAESARASLAKHWVDERLARLGEWVDRNIQKEDWNPQGKRGHIAPSAVEVLRIVEEILDVFFALPNSHQHQELLTNLIGGADRSLYRYVIHAVSNYEPKEKIVPTLPPLTRWNKEYFKTQGSKPSLGWFKKDKGPGAQKKRQVEPRNGFQVETSELQRICIRINTLSHLETALEDMEKRISNGWNRQQSNGNPKRSAVASKDTIQVSFERAKENSKQGIHRLAEAAVYRAVFTDMRSVFWEGLYVSGVENSRIDKVLEHLDLQLEAISSNLSGRLRNQVVTALMRTCFEGYLLVLLAGGPYRGFHVSDSDILDEDFIMLKDLFHADGDGVAKNDVESSATTISQILPLFSLSTEDLIKNFQCTTGAPRNRALNVTPKSWSPTDPDTLLRILCHRADAAASTFLKRTYNLPKRL